MNPDRILHQERSYLGNGFQITWGRIVLVVLAYYVAFSVGTGFFNLIFGDAWGFSSLLGHLAGALFSIRVAMRAASPQITTWKMISPKNSFPAKFLLPIFLASIGISLFASMVSYIFPLPDWYNETFAGELDQYPLAALLSFVVVAPLGEEIVYRGIFLKGLVKKYSPSTAIVLTSFLFGLVHLNIWQGVLGFGLGLLFGWLYIKTESIWPAVAGHAIVNGFGPSLFFLSKYFFGVDLLEVENTEVSMWVTFTLASVMLASGLWIFSKMGMRMNLDKLKKPVPKENPYDLIYFRS